MRTTLLLLLAFAILIGDRSAAADRDDIVAVHWPKSAEWLSKKVMLNCDTLSQFVDEITQQTGATIIVDESGLDEIGVSLDTRFQIRVPRNITVDEAFARLLSQLDVTYQLQATQIRIASIDDLEYEGRQQTYRVRPLLSVLETDRFDQMDRDSLIMLIETTIAPDTWESLGGPSTTIAHQDMITVSTSDTVHVDILRLLQTLAQARMLTAAEARQSPMLPIDQVDFDHSVTLEDLEAKIQLNFPEDPDKVPLQRLVEQLNQQTQLHFEINSRSLDESGLPSDQPVKVIKHATSISDLLTETLRDLDATYRCYGSTVFIETLDSSETNQQTVVYPIADLVARSVSKEAPHLSITPFLGRANGTYSGGHSFSGSDQWRFKVLRGVETPHNTVHPDDLTELIQRTVSSESWEMLGGPATMAYFAPASSLVVSAIDENHAKIRKLLQDVRKGRTLGGQVGAPIDIGSEFATVAFNLKANTKELADPVDLIRKNVEPRMWEQPEASIQLNGNLLIVRNRISIIGKTLDMLERLQLLQPPTQQLPGGMF